ncbi:MAG: lipid-A-disaccharide synthase [Pseudomonadota bacterium]
MSGQEPHIFIIAGEPSGDNLAGRLIHDLRDMTDGRIEISGIGGPQCEAQGLTSLFPMRELALIGIAEVVPHLPRLIRRINQTAATIRKMKPDLVVTVDAPSFTLRVAKKLRGSGIPVVHYVAPQAWAWRAGRAKTLGSCVDHLMALLPFEAPFFAKHGLPTDYVGHPAIESALAGNGKLFRCAHGIDEAASVLCVVPGSRSSEVKRMLPIFKEAVARLSKQHRALQVVIPVAPNVAELVEAETTDWPVPVLRVTNPTERFDAFAASDVAMAKSGTVTLELGLAHVPMAVAYRVSALTAFIVRRMPIAVNYASLVNLLADRMVVPELLQEDCTAEAVAAKVGHLLSSPDARAAQQKGFQDVLTILGDATPPPSERAARVVLDLISKDSPSGPSGNQA